MLIGDSLAAINARAEPLVASRADTDPIFGSPRRSARLLRNAKDLQFALLEDQAVSLDYRQPFDWSMGLRIAWQYAKVLSS